MAEKSTRVADAASGNRISTRDAYENDDGANARTVQLVDLAHRKNDWVFTNLQSDCHRRVFNGDRIEVMHIDNGYEYDYVGLAVGETITGQTSGHTAEIAYIKNLGGPSNYWYDSNWEGFLVLTNKTGNFQNGEQILGSIDGATADIVERNERLKIPNIEYLTAAQRANIFDVGDKDVLNVMAWIAANYQHVERQNPIVITPLVMDPNNDNRVVSFLTPKSLNGYTLRDNDPTMVKSDFRINKHRMPAFGNDAELDELGVGRSFVLSPIVSWNVRGARRLLLWVNFPDEENDLSDSQFTEVRIWKSLTSGVTGDFEEFAVNRKYPTVGFATNDYDYNSYY